MRIKQYMLKHHSFAFVRWLMHPDVKDTIHGPESHRKFEIIYIAQGSVRYNIEDEQYLVREGDIIFVMPNEIHTLVIDRSSVFERILVYFDFELLQKMFD